MLVQKINSITSILSENKHLVNIILHLSLNVFNGKQAVVHNYFYEIWFMGGIIKSCGFSKQKQVDTWALHILRALSKLLKLDKKLTEL